MTDTSPMGPSTTKPKAARSLGGEGREQGVDDLEGPGQHLALDGPLLEREVPLEREVHHRPVDLETLGPQLPRSEHDGPPEGAEGEALPLEIDVTGDPGREVEELEDLGEEEHLPDPAVLDVEIELSLQAVEMLAHGPSEAKPTTHLHPPAQVLPGDVEHVEQAAAST